MMASNGKAKSNNNLQNGVIDVEVVEGKENICPSSVKKHHTTIAGTDLFLMFTSTVNNVDPTTGSIATIMEQRTQFRKLAEQHHHDAKEHAHHTKESVEIYLL